MSNQFPESAEPLDCDGDPNSPYPHHWLLDGHDAAGFEMFRCPVCGALEGVDPDEVGVEF